MRKLATGLVVALVAAAFALGLAGGSLLAGGGSASRSTAASRSTSSSSTPPIIGRVLAPGPRRRPTRTQVAVRTPQAGSTTAQTPRVGPVHGPMPLMGSAGNGGTPARGNPAQTPAQTSPLIAQTPPANGSTPAAAGSAAPAGASSTPPTSTSGATTTSAEPPSSSSEPVEVGAGARGAAIGAALKLLQSAAASSANADTPAVDRVLQGLCVQLVDASLSPAGAFGSCEVR